MSRKPTVRNPHEQAIREVLNQAGRQASNVLLDALVNTVRPGLPRELTETAARHIRQKLNPAPAPAPVELRRGEDGVYSEG